MNVADACAYLDLELAQAGDPDVVRRAYAARVKVDHPDHGGAGSLLATLKAARDTLLCQYAVSPCKSCRGVGKVRSRFGVQDCMACGGSGDQP